jgi:membrane-bound lytic murein transglycosylase D
MKKLYLLITFFISPIFSFAADFDAPYLKDNIEFWKNIYSSFDSNQVIFFDMQDPKIIYYVMDLPKIPNEISAPKFSKEVSLQRDKIKKILDAIQFEEEFIEEKNELYEKIKDILGKIELNPESKMSDRLRTQSGLKSQFELGLKLSGRYMEEMKLLLKSMNMPEDLIALVFVESLFYLHAVSHASAAGPWGIMKETALASGIHVNNLVDERRDPLIATKAAANYLKKSYENLKSWPLAITSYNYGYSGTLRASLKLETNDLEKVLKEHYSPIFGFASKNYYAEFLAAKEVLDNEDKYFPGVKKEAAWKYEIIELVHPLKITDLFATQKFTKTEISQLNPSLSNRVLEGKEILPPKYALRIDPKKSKDFYSVINKIPVQKRINLTSLISSKYKASGRESLSLIAKKHGISKEYLAKRFKQGESYKPKGTIVIRSVAHLFTSIKEELSFIINKQSVAKNVK